MNYWEIFNRKTIINEDNTSKDIFKNIKYFSLENNEEKEDDKEDEEILYESKFKKFIGAINESDWNTAAVEMMDSRWATQVGPRATRLRDRVLAL